MKENSENVKKELEMDLVEKSLNYSITRDQTVSHNQAVSKNSVAINIEQRKFYLHLTGKNKSKYNYPNNCIKTTKYTFYSFLPIAFIIQFNRMANFYFLISMILSCIPSITPVSPISSILPLLLVVGISILREGFEDYSRSKNDYKENKEKVLKYNFNTSAFENINSEDIEIGDLIKVEDLNFIPADLLLLSCSNTSKVAYIETSNLDGEKNLKPKTCITQLFNILKDGDLAVGRIRGKIKCDTPNSDLYKFNGKLILNTVDEYIFDAKQFLYKGTILKNTKWVIGVVAYTGQETKIILNSQKSTHKSSKLESTVNKIIIIIFIVQSIICAILSINCYIYYTNNEIPYIEMVVTPAYKAFKTFFTFELLLNTMIPTSLIVTIEVVKVFQGYFMNNDVMMYSKIKDKFAKTNSFSLNEELGQIKYIFSDKTGTLTSNKLEFRSCAVGEQVYGDTEIDIDSDNYFRTRKVTFSFKEKGTTIDFSFPIKQISFLSISRQSGQNLEKPIVLSSNEKNSIKLECERDVMDQFLFNLSLNHSCFINNQNVKELTIDELSNLNYRGENPDDMILVDAAKHFGFIFTGANAINSYLILNQRRERVDSNFEVLKVLEYSSSRGMMSTIVKKDNLIYCYSKGGNKKITELLHNDQPFLSQIADHSTKFSEKGLRVLWVAMRIIGNEEYKNWEKEYNTSVDKPYPSDQLEKIKNEMFNKLEKGLTLIGCTAVEDKLQDDVSDCIKDFHKAGINFWVLTGDNIQTAKNIGIMCEILNSQMQIFEINDDVEKFKDIILQLCKEKDLFSEQNIINARSIISEFESQNESDYAHVSSQSYVYKKAALLIGMQKIKEIIDSQDTIDIGVLVESDILKIILPNEDSKDLRLYQHPISKLFLDITLRSKAVICCRVSPKQKSLVVRMVKLNLKNAITLAIGDGANDVSMIKEANVGVGLYGEEGTQAAMNSDYSIGEFKCLRRLLLHHGRYNYVRISDMILYYFYKNFVFTLPQLYFAFSNAFSGQTIYDSWYLTLYNTIFTNFPLVFKALMEQDLPLHCISNENIKNFVGSHIPYIYYNGRLGKTFNIKNFSFISILAFVQSVIIYLCSVYFFQRKIMNDEGQTSDLWAFSISQFTIILLVVSSRITVSQKHQTYLNIIGLLVTSWLAFIVYSIFADLFDFSDLYGALSEVVKFAPFYFIILIVSGFVLIIDMAVYFIQFNFSTAPEFELQRFMHNSKDLTGKELEESKELCRNKILFFHENLSK